MRTSRFFLQVIPLIRAAPPPSLRSVIAGMQFGSITVVWSFTLGLVLPAQPLANRISICLEVGVRDLTFALVIAMAGLPSLDVNQRAHVVVAVLTAWATCNFGRRRSSSLRAPAQYWDAVHTIVEVH